MKLCDSKLIMFEGIPGSGKSTMAKRIYQHLDINGIKTNLYSEGCDHPVDLAWHAYFTRDKFRRVLNKYSEQSEQIYRCAIIEDNYVLVPYRKIIFDSIDSDLMRYLESQEVCYSTTPVVTHKVFTQIFQRRWKSFAESSVLRNNVSIFESAFFQHHIHDLMRLYDEERGTVIKHLEAIIKEVSELKPVLFYLTQSSVKDTLLRICKQRSTAEKDTLNGFISFVENSKYGMNNNLIGLDGVIKFWEERKNIEFEAICKLPLTTYVIDNSDYDWDKVFDKIVDILS